MLDANSRKCRAFFYDRSINLQNNLVLFYNLATFIFVNEDELKIKPMKNKHVIVRADKAGVFFGILKEKNGQEVTLENVRKLHYWNGAAAVEEIAMIGTKRPNDCRFTITVPSMVIDGVCQVIPCTKESIEVIKSVKEWKA